ncbi:hypothetical protein KUBF_00340 [Bacteroides finegoldii]|nr:hypothetical protein KUBF_00340 [Bacteroides finegoldii]
MDRYHVFSTEDMKTWTDHGEILNSDDVKKQTGVGVEGFMWAPDCVYNPKDKNYYFYFPHKIQKKENGKGKIYGASLWLQARSRLQISK